MKNLKFNNFSKYLVLSSLLVTLGCNPIVDEIDLLNTVDVNDIELVAEQSTPGGNSITLKMVTPGVSGYWDYGLGRAYTDRVSFIAPIPGKQTYTFIGTLGAEYFEKSIEVQIENLDTRLDQDYYDLVSEDTNAGKTWIFRGTPGDNTTWWYMSPPNEPGAWSVWWWNAGGECCPPSDASGKMKFDLNKAANYTYINASTETKSSFDLDIENQTLTITGGGNILGAEEPRGNPSGKYTIISLTEDELILYNPNNAGGTGWTWIFKPE